jgi:hypothetical protein
MPSSIVDSTTFMNYLQKINLPHEKTLLRFNRRSLQKGSFLSHKQKKNAPSLVSEPAACCSHATTTTQLTQVNTKQNLCCTDSHRPRLDCHLKNPHFELHPGNPKSIKTDTRKATFDTNPLF